MHKSKVQSDLPVWRDIRVLIFVIIAIVIGSGATVFLFYPPTWLNYIHPLAVAFATIYYGYLQGVLTNGAIVLGGLFSRQDNPIITILAAIVEYAALSFTATLIARAIKYKRFYLIATIAMVLLLVIVTFILLILVSSLGM